MNNFLEINRAQTPTHKEHKNNKRLKANVYQNGNGTPVA